MIHINVDARKRIKQRLRKQNVEDDVEKPNVVQWYTVQCVPFFPDGNTTFENNEATTMNRYVVVYLFYIFFLIFIASFHLPRLTQTKISHSMRTNQQYSW